MGRDRRNALPDGFAFEGYRIERVLGAGGFGITYLAMEEDARRQVAVKEYMPFGLAQRARRGGAVEPAVAGDAENFAYGLERFRDEARALIMFRHPNIVAVRRYFEAHGTAYLVMDYVEGESLGGLLDRSAPLPETDILDLARPLLDGLAAVHGAGFLHRDIKPDNILVRQRDGAPVLVDFGAARQALGTAMGRQQSVTVIVSHGYAPFEQYTSRGELGPWSDIYAVGATLYACIAGAVPPPAPDRIDALLSGDPDPMIPAATAGAGRYSGRLLGVIDAALAPQARHRLRSVAELQKRLVSATEPAAS
ncbi:MAG: serine/threonine protein kinase [Rhodospirillaceae bacterium]|nr:serine/threonine protein kinase [Rhodospirillaceae bacterium]